MSLESQCTPTFAGHQTFHPRFGWIPKGYAAAVQDPGIFLADDAPVQLGVGKNMVEAIRFWASALKVLARVPHPTRKRVFHHEPTNFGSALLAKDGFDPYLEDPSSLWLLHWMALSPPSQLPVWYVAFNELTAIEFEDEQLMNFAGDEVAGTTWKQPTPSSLKKDVDCLLRMYSRRGLQGRQTLDDLLDSPFRELGMLVPSYKSHSRFRFVRGEKPGLSSAVITFACLDYLLLTDPHASTVSLTRLLSDSGSPGRIFKLSEDQLQDALESECAEHSGLSLAAPAGALQLVVNEDALEVAGAVLHRNYGHAIRENKTKSGRPLAGPGARIPEGAESVPEGLFVPAAAPSKRGAA